MKKMKILSLCTLLCGITLSSSDIRGTLIQFTQNINQEPTNYTFFLSEENMDQDSSETEFKLADIINNIPPKILKNIENTLLIISTIYITRICISITRFCISTFKAIKECTWDIYKKLDSHYNEEIDFFTYRLSLVKESLISLKRKQTNTAEAFLNEEDHIFSLEKCFNLTDNIQERYENPYPFHEQLVFSIKTPYENIDEKELDESNLRMIPFGLSEKIAEKKKLRDELAKTMVNNLKEIRNELSKKLDNLSQEEKEKVNKMKKDKMKKLLHLDEMIF